MDGILLQDWITVRGADAYNSIAQSAEAWPDLGPCEDLVFFLDVREATASTVKIFYETAPAKQETSFLAMVPGFALAAGTRTDRVFSSVSAVPPARYVRWRVQRTAGAGAWDVTFRIWLATYAWRRSWR